MMRIAHIAFGGRELCITAPQQNYYNNKNMQIRWTYTMSGMEKSVTSLKQHGQRWEKGTWALFGLK
jgi:hypothetical protein